MTLATDGLQVKKLPLGQLVIYRHKNEIKFGPSATPGLFVGWRVEPRRHLTFCGLRS